MEGHKARQGFTSVVSVVTRCNEGLTQGAVGTQLIEFSTRLVRKPGWTVALEDWVWTPLQLKQKSKLKQRKEPNRPVPQEGLGHHL